MGNNYGVYEEEFNWLVKFTNRQELQGWSANIAEQLKKKYYNFEAMFFTQIALNNDFLDALLENQYYSNRFLPSYLFSDIKVDDELMQLFINNPNDDIIIEIG